VEKRKILPLPGILPHALVNFMYLPTITLCFQNVPCTVSQGVSCPKEERAARSGLLSFLILVYSTPSFVFLHNLAHVKYLSEFSHGYPSSTSAFVKLFISIASKNCLFIEVPTVALAAYVITRLLTILYAHSFSSVPKCLWSRDSVVVIATSYVLDDRGVGVRVPVGTNIFSSPRRPDWF
jgi:hypothetical protein